MSSAEYSRKLDELDRLLNDPDVPMQPDRIWSLLADVSRPETAAVMAANTPAISKPADR
ncbi:peptide chain release factor 1 [Rhodopila sp.]|uniref:peptide chain release factor 1 n=1 Tax=Rhodopila sp. TaxID=2480087 RepID=UPI003D0BC6D8